MKISRVSPEFWAIVGVGVSLALLILGMGTFVVADHSSMRAEMRSIRSDMSSEINALRSDMSNEINALRSDMRSGINALRSENRDDHIAIRSDIEALAGRISHVEGRLGVPSSGTGPEIP